jgi:hypothetical protein
MLEYQDKGGGMDKRRADPRVTSTGLSARTG